ncbi:hypothetical protein ADICYQ_2725 [Cyclobacterium qasimii M12-11B]|uniref:Uncharacterized protein n=1 Tax=Cyclobacterium qasimii M12-11B TaxID=641524 RepID=S7VDG3_9BACT|nr:hypothetical protein ADICYQ_2725 [Cyclobacterium qasimii M12-11B]
MKKSFIYLKRESFGKHYTKIRKKVLFLHCQNHLILTVE